jgi:hypothetical protein
MATDRSNRFHANEKKADGGFCLLSSHWTDLILYTQGGGWDSPRSNQKTEERSRHFVYRLCVYQNLFAKMSKSLSTDSEMSFIQLRHKLDLKY